MEALTLRQLLEAVNGTLLGDFDDLDAQAVQVSTDSRNITPGCLFIPLEGERFDGHSFIQAALEAGAAGCLTARERESYLPGRFYIPARPVGAGPVLQKALPHPLHRRHRLGGEDHHQGYDGGGAGGKVPRPQNGGEFQQRHRRAPHPAQAGGAA